MIHVGAGCWVGARGEGRGTRGARMSSIALPIRFGVGLVLLGLLCAIGLAAPMGRALAAENLTVTGTIASGTAGWAAPSNLTVVLTGKGTDQKPLPDQAALVDASGRFTFAPVAGASSLEVSTVVDGVTYRAPVALSASGAAPVTLKVYQPTTSNSAIRIDSANWVFAGFDLKNEQIIILETLNFENASDQTFVGDHHGDPGSDLPGILPRTLRLSLPVGASDFSPQAGLEPGTLLPVAGGWVSTAPVLPGPHQVVYTYRIAYAEGGMELRKGMDYPIGTLHVLIPNVGLEIRSDHLNNGGTTDLDGRSYLMLEAKELPANTVVTVQALGVPSTAAGRIDPDLTRYAGIGVVILALLAALILGVTRLQAAPSGADTERLALTRAIAQLDDQFAAGEIKRAEYQAERAARKSELIDLLMGGRIAVDGPGAG